MKRHFLLIATALFPLLTWAQVNESTSYQNEAAGSSNSAAELVLHRVNRADFNNPEKNDAAQLIQEFNGQTVTVKFSNNDYPATAFNIIPDKWYALVLPFDTKPFELTLAIGSYAYVNTLDTENTRANIIRFKTVTNKIPANTPFVFKIAEAKDLNAASFSNKKIVYSENPIVEDLTGVEFIGSYTGKIGFAANEYFFTVSSDPKTYDNYYSGSATNTTYLRPMGAYLKITGAAGRTITFEEPDGSITTIQPMNADNMGNEDVWYTIDGIKLNVQPTAKGIYINNGKKIVIK